VDLVEGSFNIVSQDSWSLSGFQSSGGSLLNADGISDWCNSTQEGIDCRIVWLTTHLGWMRSPT
jgi:hypothetical protein